MPIVLAFALALSQMTGMRASRVLVVLYALKLGAGPVAIGLLAATFAFFPMVLSWHAGKVVDRHGSRLPLTYGAAIGACGLLLPYFFPSLAMVFAAGVLIGLSSTFYNLSLQNLIGTLSKVNTRTRNYSNYAMVISTANAAGPLLAGFAIDRAGYGPTFLTAAGLMAMPVLLLLAFGRVLPGGRTEPAPALGFRDTLTNPQIWPVLAASSIAQSGLELFNVYIPVYGDANGLSASAIGVIIAMCAVGGFAARLLLMRLISLANEERVLAYALFLGAASFVAVPFFKTALVLSLIAFVFGFGVNCTQPIALTLMYSRSPKGRSGEALGLRFALDNAARLVAPVIFGMIGSAVGLGAVFWVNAVVLAAGGALTRMDRPKCERTRT